MRTCSRRSLLSAIGVSLPLGLAPRARASATPPGSPPVLRLLPFEEAVRAAFGGPDRTPSEVEAGLDPAFPRRRVEVGYSESLQSGVQGSHNDRPFAGFPARHLRIVRAASQPGPALQGARLYVSTVDVVLTGGLIAGDDSRPLDFASLPPAPAFSTKGD